MKYKYDDMCLALDTSTVNRTYHDINVMLYFYKYGEIFMFHCFHLYITYMRINMLERTLHTMVGEGKLYDTKTTKIRQLKG